MRISDEYTGPFIEYARFRASSHGNPLLVDQRGFEYYNRRDNRNPVRNVWRCRFFRRQCRVQVVTIGEKIVSINGEHTHLPTHPPDPSTPKPDYSYALAGGYLKNDE